MTLVQERNNLFDLQQQEQQQEREQEQKQKEVKEKKSKSKSNELDLLKEIQKQVSEYNENPTNHYLLRLKYCLRRHWI